MCRLGTAFRRREGTRVGPAPRRSASARKHESEGHIAEVRARVEEFGARYRRQGDRSKLIASMVRRRLREDLKSALVDEGMRARAATRLAEHVHVYQEHRRVVAGPAQAAASASRCCGPSIVESAHEFSVFQVWNESFNGNGAACVRHGQLVFA